MAVMRDSKTYTSGFIAEGLGAFFDGLIILAMDGDQHRQVRSLLQPAFMPEAVNKWRPEIEEIMRRDFLEPLAPKKKADIMEFGLFFPIRVMYALMGFPTDDPEKYKKFLKPFICAFEIFVIIPSVGLAISHNSPISPTEFAPISKGRK